MSFERIIDENLKKTCLLLKFCVLTKKFLNVTQFDSIYLLENIQTL